MNISDFDYDLPASLIAQTPVEPRDSSRLLVLHRDSGRIEHRIFRDIGEYLHPGDLLVANQSRVLPARLSGIKRDSGGKVELLLLGIRGDLGSNCWEALVRPGRRIREGTELIFGEGRLIAEVLSRTAYGARIVVLSAPDGDVASAVQTLGSTPLPPYIHEPLADSERYQTVYARDPGSAAAPTAGLHFTAELLERLRHQGVDTVFVTLHIGLDTFRPIDVEHLEDHIMHSEEIEVDAATAARINKAHASGGRLLAVGTTAVRTLESVAERLAEIRADPLRSASIPDCDIVMPFRGRTSLFLRPSSTFRAVDMMLTNFHLPKSTLVVLVSAFAGRDMILGAYHEAMAQGYRFYSFGDAMLII